METTVTRKGQVTIPVEHRRKCGITEGMKMEVVDGPTGVLLCPVQDMRDLAGVDKGKYSHAEMSSRLTVCEDNGVEAPG